MTIKIRIALLVFSLIWFIIIGRLIRKKKISIRYSLTWLLCTGVIMIVGLFPFIAEWITNVFGFVAVSNFVLGIIITLLMLITLRLTIVLTEQKNVIKNLVQKISIDEEIKKKK